MDATNLALRSLAQRVRDAIKTIGTWSIMSTATLISTGCHLAAASEISRYGGYTTEEAQWNGPTTVDFDPDLHQIDDAEFAHIVDAVNSFPHVNCLGLAGSNISDASIPAILKLRELESLDLWGTNVSLRGVLELSALPRLKKVGIALSDQEAQEVRNSLPRVDVNTQPTIDVSGLKIPARPTSGSTSGYSSRPCQLLPPQFCEQCG